MKTFASLAAAAAILTTATFAAPAAQASPYFYKPHHHHHHHGYWGGPVLGGLALAAAMTAPATSCYTVKRKVFIPGAGIVIRRTVICD